MANQRVSNERRRELEQPDAFQENLVKGYAWAKAHQKQLLVGIGTIALVVVVFSAILYSFKTAENSAVNLLAKAMKIYEKAENPEKGYLAVKDLFGDIFSEYSNTAAGRMAKVNFAKICYDASEFDTSFKYYTEALDEFDNETLMKNLILSALGHVCLAKGDLEAARAYFQKVEKGDAGLLKDEAQFALALILEKSNQPDESRAMYEKVVASKSDSIYADVAQGRAALLK